MKLTKGQQGALAFIARYVGEHGYPPTMREVCVHLGATSTNAAATHIKALIDKGAVFRKERNASRGITITAAGHAYLRELEERSQLA